MLFRRLDTGRLLVFTVKMSENKASGNLSRKLKESIKKGIVEGVKKEAADNATTSPYFSPRKTRNRVKIEYERPEEETKKKIPTTEAVQPTKSKSSIKKETQVKVENTQKQSSKRSSNNTEFSTDNEATNKTTKWEPDNWKEVIENLKIMRQNVPAPVDTMGCDKCSDENADAKTQRFHKLIALMLSSQTKDQVTYEAMNRLKSRNLTPENVVSWKNSELEDLLKPVSFYKNKTKYIQKAAQILIDEYDSDIPNTAEGLMKLPGVGPKMAHICMNTAWNIISGIGVDVHVHRICNRMKWVRKPTKQPEETRIELESWLPSEHWSEVNALLVGFGQTICAPVNPKCDNCLNNHICPSAKLTKKKSASK